MTRSDTGPPTRILVSLGTSVPTLHALSTAITLAARLGAQVEGLFVEDVQVLRAAALPFTTELSLPSGVSRPLHREGVEAELRAVAAAAREALRAAASASGVRWSFRVARGSLRVELLHASRQAHVLVIGRDGGHRPGAPTMVVYDGSPASDEALEVAAQLAARSRLVLLVPARNVADARRIAGAARERHPRQSMEERWVGATGWQDRAGTAAAAARLVVSARMAGTEGAGLERLLETTAGELVIVS